MFEDIPALFAKAIEVSGVVGAQLSIVKDGQRLDICHGLANVATGLIMTDRTLIQVGSVTKVFNAAMVMSLVEERILDLDEPVSAYIPYLSLGDVEAAKTITLRHLLSMSSGLDNGDYQDLGGAEDAIERRVRSLAGLPQHFAPGAAFGYSNAGTDIAGHICERVTGQSWHALLRARVLDPIGLDATTDLAELVFHATSVGYAVDPHTGALSAVRPWGLPRGLAPAGSTLASSARDLATFGQIFVNRGMVTNGQRILAEATVNAMLSRQIDVPVHSMAIGWGLGLCENNWDGTAVWGHRGGNSSGASYLYCIPDQHASIAWIVNTIAGMPRFEKIIAQDVMRAAFGIAKPTLAAPAHPVAIDPCRYVGTYRSLAGDCTVTADDAGLTMLKRSMSATNEADHVTDRATLIPLGDDRFLIDRGDLNDRPSLPEDMAFFGNIHGKAANLTNYVFPSSRVGQ